MRRIKIWIDLIVKFLLSVCCVRKADLLSADETIDWVIRTGTSLIRLGDGELNILDGLDVHYQKADPHLSQEMAALIEDYCESGEVCGYLLCMPNEFLKCSGFALLKRKVWVASWSRFRYVFKKRYDRELVYGDAFLFARKYEIKYRDIWKNKKDIIFVHNNKKYADQFSSKYGIRTHFIKVAEKDCYRDIDAVTNEIMECAEGLGSQFEDLAVLISAGPCAKAIVYRLRNAGIQLIDTGHCWDDPLALRE